MDIASLLAQIIEEENVGLNDIESDEGVLDYSGGRYTLLDKSNNILSNDDENIFVLNVSKTNTIRGTLNRRNISTCIYFIVNNKYYILNVSELGILRLKTKNNDSKPETFLIPYTPMKNYLDEQVRYLNDLYVAFNSWVVPQTPDGLAALKTILSNIQPIDQDVLDEIAGENYILNRENYVAI